MLVDWFTVGAQTINFIILVWLLKRFLYQPILAAIDAREKRIASELADADTKRTQALAERDEFQQKNDAFDQQRAALLNQATREAENERRRLLDEARAAADAWSAKHHETLRREAQTLHDMIRHRVQHEVFAIARRALTDLAGQSLEERMVNQFVQKLRALNGEERSRLAALGGSGATVIVRTAFDLAPAQQTSTEGAIGDLMGTGTRVRFETAPDLVSGIELAADGHKVAWSIAQYLASLEKGAQTLLEQAEGMPKREGDALEQGS
jgi:F-type H+-transporting ATPase subunit b